MTILIAPDKFKGSLDSFALCQAIANGVKDVYNDANIVSLPLADGGDGFGAVMGFYLQTTPVVVETEDAAGNPIHAQYQWSDDSKTAIIELASASGLAILEKRFRNPLTTSTRGTGIMVRHALNNGAETIVLGIGGSATNDGGTGLLSALGYRFLDDQQNILGPNGTNLGSIETIEPPNEVTKASFVIACDVNNPLLGENGTAKTYAAQKGAGLEDIELLEHGMQRFALVIEKYTGRKIADIQGTGAAGGTSAGLMVLQNVILQKGAEIVLSYSGFHQHLSHADLVITGEGGFDAQTLQGKVVYVVAQACKEKGTPCIAICGKVDADEATIKASGLSKVVAISDEGKDSFGNAEELVRETVKELLEKRN